MRSVLASVSVSLVLLSCALIGGAAAQDKLAPVDGVNFALGSVDGVFIPDTTSDPATEAGVMPVSLRGIAGSAPAEVEIVMLEIAYPVDQLAWLGGSLDDFGAIDPVDVVWQGDASFSEENGVVTVILDAYSWSTPAAFTEFCYLKFAPLCQESGATATVTVQTGPGESQVITDGVIYTDPTDPEPSGDLTVAEYAGYVSVLDPDPADGEPVALSVGGAVDAGLVVDVPVYLSSNANVWRVQGYIPYDETRLNPVDFIPGDDCNPWAWTYNTPPVPIDGNIYLDLTNWPFADNDLSSPCTVVTVRFELIGDWRGETESLEFIPFSGGIYVGRDWGTWCPDIGPVYDFHSGDVTMEEYAAAVALQVDDMIYAADAGTNKVFEAVLAAAHNFTIGGDAGAGDPYASSLRLDLDLALDMNILNLYQPDLGTPDPGNPLDDFWFDYMVGTAKSPQQKLEFSTSHKPELAGVRAPQEELVPLLKMDLLQQNVTAPATFDEPGFALALQCQFADRPARLRDAVTGVLEVACGNGLTLDAAPALSYANGEITCDERTSTRPADVVQPYYLRSTFPVTDFRVTVNESGPHNIIDVTPAAGVEILEQGTSYVTFGPGPDWIPAVFAERFEIGSITYSESTSIPDDVFDKSADKDIGPPIRWCWRWTNIGFGADSYVRDATGQETFLFTATGRVGTRYDCSIIVNPDEPDVAHKSLPRVFALHGNHPNPFNPETIISFDLPRESSVRIVVHDLLGRRVAVLLDDVRGPGRHEVVWHGRDQSGRPVASGTYFYAMKAGDFEQRGKMVLLK